MHAAFDARGKASFDHTVLTSIQRGPHCLFEGAVDDLPDGGTGSFISSLSLAADGTIRRYVSFYCEPAVPMSDREQILDVIATYARTVDDRDIDGIVGCFTADGRIDFEGGQTSGEGAGRHPQGVRRRVHRSRLSPRPLRRPT